MYVMGCDGRTPCLLHVVETSPPPIPLCLCGAQVTFEDLMKGLSMLSQHASREHKLLLSFYLLDPEGTGFITKRMTTALLRSCLAECNGASHCYCCLPVEIGRMLTTDGCCLPSELDISLSDEQIARIVDSTFEEADLDHNDLIDLQEYQVQYRSLFLCCGCSWRKRGSVADIRAPHRRWTPSTRGCSTS